MNWIALGAVTELIAALAFLASFLFIKQQMKQNHDVTKASHQREILNASRDFFDLDEAIRIGRCIQSARIHYVGHRLHADRRTSLVYEKRWLYQ